MSGREERARAQSRLLSGRPGYFVCQITLNVPGFPKRMDGDEALIKVCRADFLARLGREPLDEVSLLNGAGLALLMLFAGDRRQASDAKRAGIFIEENKSYGRAIDADVITIHCTLSRKEFNFGPRGCLVCGKNSKECSRARKHSYKDLRALTQVLINKIIADKE